MARHPLIEKSGQGTALNDGISHPLMTDVPAMLARPSYVWQAFRE